MAKFNKKDTIAEFQKFTSLVYGLPDDRQYSIWDMLTQQQRFTMRALKGIRKENVATVRNNICISFAWLMGIANRLHINIEDEVWNRFPYVCSYCGKAPCACKATKFGKRAVVKIDNHKRPHSLGAFQKMFEEVYPSKNRTAFQAGVHLAEEMGEVSEAVHNYLGQHLQKQFIEVKLELADLVSCIFGVVNSLNIDLAKELEIMFKDNCHICHKVPCECTFSQVASLRS
ncbi:MAG: hypothetical protein KBC48_00210 [Candidatus Pacebacteria bacterium]|nr:hypothetical protein [Candidatus Paceibacterota bacterium]